MTHLLTVGSGKGGVQAGQQQQQQRVAGTQEQQAGRETAEVSTGMIGHTVKGTVVVIDQDHSMKQDEAAVVGCSRGTSGPSTCSSSIGRVPVVMGRHVTVGSGVVTSMVAITIREKAADTAAVGGTRGIPTGVETMQDGVGVGSTKMVGGDDCSRMVPFPIFVMVPPQLGQTPWGPDSLGATLLNGGALCPPG
jgi:hypothetical protein